MTVDEEQAFGEGIVKMFSLKPVRGDKDCNGQPKYRTAWGTKTPIGLARTMNRLIALKGEI